MKVFKLSSWLPLTGLAFCIFASVATWTFGGDIVSLLNPALSTLTVEHSPGGVHGADLVADLLTISALTISVCIAYICLPSDRIEIRIATYVRMSLSEQLIEEEAFKAYYSSLDPDHRTPSCKLIKGFLAPRAGIGGWHDLSEEDVSGVLGKGEWGRFSRYVNDHLDEDWVKLQLFILAAAMMAGFISLFRRYFGLDDLYIVPFEMASILFLLLTNACTGMLLIYLSLGGHTGERSVRSRIKNCVNEVKTSVQGYQVNRRDLSLKSLDTGMEKVVKSGSRPRNRGNEDTRP